MGIGNSTATTIAFAPCRPPRRNDTSAKPSRRIRRATIDAAAGVHISAQTHDKAPATIMSRSSTAESGTRTAKYIASPRRARSLVSCSAAAFPSVLTLGLFIGDLGSRIGSFLRVLFVARRARSAYEAALPFLHPPPGFAERGLRNVDPAANEPHSALMLRARITLPHFSVSSAMHLAKSAGEPANTATPRSVRRFLIFGSARAALISLLSVSTIAMGVPLGVTIPYQPLAS